MELATPIRRLAQVEHVDRTLATLSAVATNAAHKQVIVEQPRIIALILETASWASVVATQMRLLRDHPLQMSPGLSKGPSRTLMTSTTVLQTMWLR